MENKLFLEVYLAIQCAEGEVPPPLPPGADDCCRVSADDCEEEIGCTVTCTWLKIFVYHLPSLSMEWCTYQKKIV